MKKEIVERITNNFQDISVMVLGDLMLDRYLWGSVDRISPEAPVPVVQVDKETSNPGAAANVAANITSLGAKAILIGVVGDDSFAEMFKKSLYACKIQSSHLVVDSDRSTTVKTRIVAHSQQVVRIDREITAEIGDRIVEEVLEKAKNQMPKVQGIVISDYGKGVITYRLLSELISLANKAGKFIAVDPKEVHFKNYRDVSVITPNHHEAGFVSGKRITSDKILEDVGWDLIDSLNLESLLITLGEKGMTLFEKDHIRTDIPVKTRTVYDVTGAGDTVIATLTVARLAGATMQEAAFISNVAAGLAVARFGTARITQDELRKALIERV